MVKILVAEDSPTQAAQLQNLLEECGYTVVTASDGLLALEIMRQQKPDLVISDVIMPRMDGYELCKAIKSDDALRTIPVLLVTSLSSPQDVIRGLGCGADSFIRKPYEEKYLISRIEYLRANQILRQQEQSQMGLEMYLGGQRHFITAERQQILDLLISTYAEAIRLNDGLNRSNQWLHGLYRIAEGLNQTESEDDVCQMAVRGAVELPGIQASWIMLHEQGAAPRLAAAEGLDFADETITETVAETIDKSRESHARIRLWAGDQTFGVMNLIGAEDVEFNDEDLSILQGVGNQVGIALERAQLRSHLERMVQERTAALRAENIERKAAEEEAKRRLEQLHALHIIDKTIIAVEELPKSLGVIVEQVATQLRVDAVSILIYETSTQTLRYMAGTGFRHDDIRNTAKSMGQGHVGRVAVSRVLDFVPDLRASTDFANSPTLEREGFVSYLGIPLIAQGELKGVLEIFQRSPLSPTPEWLGFLQALALQTAIAIDHEQLFSQTRHLLQRSQEEARKVTQVMDTVPEGVIFLDRDSRIQLANDAGERCLSLLANAKVGDSLTQLGDRPLSEMVVEARTTDWQELSILDGRHIYEIAARPMQVNSQIEGWVLVVREVTFERQNQQRMQVQERLATVGQLAAGIAHDFNNLLVPITLYSELMLASVAPGSRMWSNLDKILLAANRAKELVRQILTFSRQSPSQKREPVHLQSLINEVLKLLWATLPTTIEVRQEVSPTVGSIYANPVEIHQVLMNLCTNAYQAMQKRGGTLTIYLENVNVDPDFVEARSNLKLGPYVRLAVRDTGHGIDPAIRERIFDPFFTTKPAGEGTGMGLSVVYGIVASYGGDIVVESVPGEGAAFSIYLPQFSTMPERLTTSETKLVGGSECILLVDDEEDIVQVTKLLLTGLGYAVVEHTSSLTALANFREQPDQFDLVLTDLTMPHMNGITLAQEVLSIRPDMPILLVSGAHENFSLEIAEQIGVDVTLMKPFQAHELATRIRVLLDGVAY